MREPLPRTEAEADEDAYWDRLYGPWAPLDPEGLRLFFAGFERPWWIVGGWSIEAFTGAPRVHEDVDASILACDVAALRAHVGDRWQLWNICNGSLRPLTDRWPEVVEPDSQIWVRRDAGSPWLIDLPLTPDRDGRWTNKRLPDHVADVHDVTFVHDGIRYLAPEIALLYKSRLRRLKDRRDLDATWPLLDDGRRAWLRDAVRRLDAEHPWLPLLEPAAATS